ncbi:MAG TPA: DUF5684 domain-containing protein [Candidatus Saccharibacteria bacterium]|nr:DUF5684 domain-containing protein [Candidatus Saccharibacteria bacterium]
MAFLQGSAYLALLLIVVSYLSYMIGLIRVLRRIDRLTWKAFVPILNYYASVRAVNAPRRWFFYALIPYVGAIYAGSVAVRLGAIFGKGITFSLFWLTFGSPVGMHVIARTPEEEINKALLEKRLGILDIRRLRRELLRRRMQQRAKSGT